MSDGYSQVNAIQRMANRSSCPRGPFLLDLLFAIVSVVRNGKHRADYPATQELAPDRCLAPEPVAGRTRPIWPDLRMPGSPLPPPGPDKTRSSAPRRQTYARFDLIPGGASWCHREPPQFCPAVTGQNWGDHPNWPGRRPTERPRARLGRVAGHLVRELAAPGASLVASDHERASRHWPENPAPGGPARRKRATWCYSFRRRVRPLMPPRPRSAEQAPHRPGGTGPSARDAARRARGPGPGA